MRTYVCFDDTDTLDCGRGTGKFARWFGEKLPSGYACWGVVRQQLLFDPRVPFTSHNSAACVVVDTIDGEAAGDIVATLREIAAEHLAEHFIDGSDPGLCIACDDGSTDFDVLVGFGRLAAEELVTQEDARKAAALAGVHLSGHGGTEDGIIGALAGAGLTHWGWSGRFIEYGDLRAFEQLARVRDLEAAHMLVLPVDRNVIAPKADDVVDTGGWLRPRLVGGRAVVPVQFDRDRLWLHLTRRMPGTGHDAQ